MTHVDTSKKLWTPGRKSKINFCSRLVNLKLKKNAMVTEHSKKVLFSENNYDET